MRTGHKLWNTTAIIGILMLAGCGEAESAESSVAASTAGSTTTAVPETTTTTTAAPPTTTTTTTTTAPPTTTTTKPPAEEIVVAVPSAPPPTIDGTVEETEWAGAASATMSDGTTVLLMRDDDVLHAAIVGNEVGGVNVIIATADQVSILHSSAALGSAAYEANGSTWDLVHGFDWCCRDAADAAASDELFAAEGWKANIGYAGDRGVVEYRIAIPWREARFAVSSIRDDADKGFWPAELTPEARDQLLGVPPPQRSYNIDEWATLTAGG